MNNACEWRLLLVFSSRFRIGLIWFAPKIIIVIVIINYSFKGVRIQSKNASRITELLNALKFTLVSHIHILFFSLISPLQQNWCYGGEWSGIIYLNCSLMNKAIALTVRVKKTCHIWYRKWLTSSFLNEKKYLNNYEKDITQTNPSEIIFEVNQMKPIFLKKKRLTEAVIRRCSSK